MEKEQTRKRFNRTVYIVGAYGGEPENKEYMEQSCIRLSEEYPNYLILNGITEFAYMYKITDYQKGLDMCLEFMTKMADEVWVLPNYENSIGSHVEIAIAKEYEIPVKYIKFGENMVELKEE